MAEMKRWTRREFLNEVIEFVGDGESKLKDYAIEELEKMDKANENRRNKPSKKDIENAPLIEDLKTLLNDEPQTASDLAPQIEVSVQKASALLRKMVAQDEALVEDIKVKGKGTQKGYTLILLEEEEEDAAAEVTESQEEVEEVEEEQ